jgi:hypothetical protein
MAYQIACLKCQRETWSGNIADLIEAHTDLRGRLICGQCGETEVYVDQITGRHEKEPEAEWNEYIKGVIRVAADSAAYTPYVFLTAKSVDGEVSAIRLSYYRDPGPNGRRMDGLGPGTAPALTPDELRQLLIKLGSFGFVRAEELEMLAQIIRLEALVHSRAELGSALPMS